MRAKSNLRKSDEALSNKVSAFLDNTFYKGIRDFERIVDKDRQVKGLDTIFTLNNEKYYCDEKCAVQWRNLKTFAFEVSFIGIMGDVVDGWLVNNKCENNSYLCIWIDTCGDGEEIEAALVKKEKVLGYLNGLGWTKDRLMKKSEQIREHNGHVNLGEIEKNGCRFVLSKHLVEKPVNVLLSRNTIIGLSDFVFKSKYD